MGVRVTLIHNPTAGHQGAGQARKLTAALESRGHEVRYHSAKEDGWKAALKKPADLVLVAGGDGTIGRVARRLVGRGVPLALLPIGTANNIAHSLGLDERPFDQIIDGLDRARHITLDVGVAEGPWGERYFVEGVGAGLFADLLVSPEVTRKIRNHPKPVQGALQRLQQLTAHREPLEVTGTLDGRNISGRYLLLEALNLSFVGPNLHLTQGKPGDGRLDVVLVTEAERGQLQYYLEHWQNGHTSPAVLPTLRGKSLKLEWTGYALHIDDKLRPDTDEPPKKAAGPVEARVDDQKLEFLVP
jgi:diacylglycerol kinase family enzyme